MEPERGLHTGVKSTMSSAENCKRTSLSDKAGDHPGLSRLLDDPSERIDCLEGRSIYKAKVSFFDSCTLQPKTYCVLRYVCTHETRTR